MAKPAGRGLGPHPCQDSIPRQHGYGGPLRGPDEPQSPGGKDAGVLKLRRSFSLSWREVARHSRAGRSSSARPGPLLRGQKPQGLPRHCRPTLRTPAWGLAPPGVGCGGQAQLEPQQRWPSGGSPIPTACPLPRGPDPPGMGRVETPQSRMPEQPGPISQLEGGAGPAGQGELGWLQAGQGASPRSS